MTDDRQPTCEDRIAGQLAGRAEDVRRMLAASNGDTLCKYCGERITEEHVKEDDDPSRFGLPEAGYIWTHDEDIERVVCREGGNVLTGEDPIATPDTDYTENSLHDFGLGISRKVVLRFDMSTGGPADWLEILCEEERGSATSYVLGTVDRLTSLTVERVTYHFSDWFDHAEENVPEGSPLYELAEWIAETQS